MDNLNLNCAEFGRRLSALDDVDEKLLQDSLSVLEEQGMYAFFLYLKAHGKLPGKEMIAKCQQFLRDNQAIRRRSNSSGNDIFEEISELSKSIDDLIFARELLMQALVYARYHSKARNTSEKKA